MKLNLKKQYGQLVPYSQEDKEKIDKFADGAVYEVDIKNFDNRTTTQNRALHKYFSLLANELNTAGLTISKMIKVEVEWSPHTVKELLWKPVQMALLNKDSTTKLTKDEVSKVYDTLNLALGQKKGISVPFPSQD